MRHFTASPSPSHAVGGWSGEGGEGKEEGGGGIGRGGSEGSGGGWMGAPPPPLEEAITRRFGEEEEEYEKRVEELEEMARRKRVRNGWVGGWIEEEVYHPIQCVSPFILPKSNHPPTHPPTHPPMQKEEADRKRKGQLGFAAMLGRLGSAVSGRGGGGGGGGRGEEAAAPPAAAATVPAGMFY